MYFRYEEFQPMLFKQFENKPFCMFDNFNKSVDEFFSQIESQKLDMKALQQVCIGYFKEDLQVPEYSVLGFESRE